MRCEWEKYFVGDICSSISDTYRGSANKVVLVNTSDVLEGKVLNHQLVQNEHLKGQFKKTFCLGDTLYSEIRPQNKRFAFVDFDSDGYIASTKLMVIRANSRKILPRFLYYFLTSKQVISKMQTLAETRSGTFPQITFSELSSVDILLPPTDIQQEIVNIIKCLDDKIELNQRINENLERQAFEIFRKMLANASLSTCHLSQIATINPKRILKKGEYARCIDMSQLSTSGSFPNGWEMKLYNGGMKFKNGDTLLARITPCLENGKTAYIDFLNKNEIAFGSTEYVIIASQGEYPPEFFYCLARYPAFVDYAVKNMNGSSGRQRVSAETIEKFVLPMLSKSELSEFCSTVPSFFKAIRNNSIENIRLAQIRDSLLPRLMAGEIDVSNIQIKTTKL